MPLNAQLRPLDSAPMIQLSSDFIRAKEYLEAIVTSTSDAICTTDTRGRIMYFSPGAELMLGVSAGNMLGRRVEQLYAEGRADAERVMRLLKRDGKVQNHELVLKATEGRLIHVSMSAALLRDRAGRVIGTLGISKDITRRVELEKRLRELSITDNLTGLYNQRHFRERLGQEVSRARRQRQKLSMILIDLDGFKAINDEQGHLAGDRVLRAFAEVLLQGIRREVDSAYRYGGDEFIVLLPGLSTPKADRVAERLACVATKSVIGFSYGVAALPATGSISDFMRIADRRMYRMKTGRKK